MSLINVCNHSLYHLKLKLQESSHTFEIKKLHMT